MARRNNKKLADLKSAREFVQEVISVLDQHENTPDLVVAVEECIKKMPKLDTQPAIKRRYTSLLNHVVNGRYKASVMIPYFQRESLNLRIQIDAL